ncbi:PQQ-dependent dehydrogenase, methanol/ethanol family [Gluconacetobacter entanii]|uniref:PQQ-dependent dehydrogenase, methanol/ethanol family n=1 Tax=Gluconacetobacter entanii TaxID=108528 RepID=A0ABT3K998_9PROT|nr:PQQ-dependent dehydrogenase, methanol/ethanol family [Gluconacetobacter entanii]MBE7620037.1 PQQ-dependent dehydrogenase, methanol/ethanol family [Komagataeibacter sp. FXV2]MCE2579947.1 PQQ-dependent dehydrogenase, methanol/ethanol family [Komagataeibacter sp. FNDCR1]MBY4639374.1 PQQ-dependent dehydrogenase, methanol/ethanol family [Gluconacetobacter entanii]MCW4582148.1 PQQ-dependent dehydrogenase, methanol/ethanol family [Gluconacetobacter entanii]MCW4585493.1 PQQ-dependent dehydrogenase,
MISAVFGKRRSLSRTLTAGTICAALVSGYANMAFSADEGQGQTGEAIIHADDHPGDWMTYGRTYSEQRYSPLDQINRSNVGNLKLAWYLDLDTNRGQEGTPLVVDGVMYATTNWSMMKAIDAATGKLLWSYDPRVPGNIADKGCCDTVNRGAAYWNGKVYFGTFDGRLIALDAKTGKLVWSVNTIPPDAELGKQRSYTVDGAPRIAKGRVIIGNGGSEFGARGFVTAFDAETGKVDWRFFTVPNPKNEPDHAASDSVLMNKAYQTWSPTGAWTRQGGGGTVWDSLVYDPVTDLVYLGVGNGSPWNYKYRSEGKGDNLFLGSIVALKPETGEYVWHFQETPMDQWDFTSVQQIMTLDLPINGETRHVIVHAPKNGFFYIIDAKTGEFISGKNYVYVNWASGLDPKTGRPIYNPDALYTLTGKDWYGIPGDLGGHNFAAMAFSPKTGLVYIPAQQVPFLYTNQKGGFLAHPDSWNLGLDMNKVGIPDSPEAKAAFVKDLKGWIVAWDPQKQAEAWRVDHKGPWNGGILATGGDLLFQGLANGEFHAYDATNGTDLFHFAADSGIIAPPVTYLAKGKQYVAVEVGWGGIYPFFLGGLARTSGWTVNHSHVIAFSLDGKAGPMPKQNDQGFLPVKPPEKFDASRTDNGYFQFQTYCAACHGDNAEGAGVLPDLRWSGSIRHTDAFYNVVGRGALTAYGMDRFDGNMNPNEIEDIRQYLIKRANETYQREVDARKNAAGIPEQLP